MGMEDIHMLWRRWHSDLWTLDHPLVVGGLHLGVRATAARSPQGEVLLFAPVPFSDEAASELESLGQVAAIVAPNRLHWMFAAGATKRWPDARLIGADGLEKKAPDLRWETLGTQADPLWRGWLEQLPLEGVPELGETLFFHPASRTLVATDLCFNVVSSDSWFTRTFMRLNGAYGGLGPSRIFKRMVKDRAAVRRSVDRVLELGPERVVVAHGAVHEQGGTEALAQGFQWLE